MKVTDLLNNNYFSATNQTYATWYAAFYGTRQVPGKYPIKQGKQEDLLKDDIWQLSITLFCLVNPGLNALFNIECDRMKIYPNLQKGLLQTI